MPKEHGRNRGNTLRVYLYAQRAWANQRKHPAGIPVCPKSMGETEETPCGYTCMPKEHGRNRGKETVNL
ncbi:hypothetical protein H171_0369 [[Clostridium] celerecrescens 18A]|uniref:Uncharacterized protein n=1 Tax=[Clostridium] celerecrescens 18A TaxID=1286362 RepID=A0A2M8Z0F1_9FIRM|nr:hypothetical protein H171_0369 [[Clostridium] celerecrescens 18A]